jgi:hypothetical protein
MELVLADRIEPLLQEAQALHGIVSVGRPLLREVSVEPFDDGDEGRDERTAFLTREPFRARRAARLPSDLSRDGPVGSGAHDV